MHLVTDAILIHRAEYREVDRMITLFSPEHGRIDAVARGCRRGKSPLLAGTEMFVFGEYELSEGGGRYSLARCTVRESFEGIRYDVDRLTHAVYCTSLADAAALPGQPAREIFVLLYKALTHLAYSDLPPALLSSAFEMRYMPLMGYTPVMDRCVLCGAPVDGECRFDAARGGVVCARCPSSAPRLSGGARRIILRAAQTDYNLVPKLDGHPDWPEAARRYRPFVTDRIERRVRILPDLPANSESGQPE